MTTEFFGLHPSWVSNQQGSVVCHELLLQLHRTVGIDIFRVIGNNGFGNGLSNGIDLRRVSSTLYTDTDIEHGKRLFASDKDGFVNLEAQDLRLDEVDG